MNYPDIDISLLGATIGERTGWEIIPTWKRAELRETDVYLVLMIIFE